MLKFLSAVNWTTPTPSLSDKLSIIQDLQEAFSSLYVHLPMKLASFGAEVDPRPKLSDLILKCQNMTGNQFYNTIWTFFNDLRDLHTHIGIPHSGIGGAELYTGFKFEWFNNKPIALKHVGSNQQPAWSTVKEGDELIAVNSLPLYKYIELNHGGGANPDAARRCSLDKFSRLDITRNPIPEPIVTFTFARNEQKFDVPVPWLFSEQRLPEPEWIGFTPSPTDTISWMKVGDIGIIRIKGFFHGANQVELLLKNELATTSAFIIDVRGNTGGDVGMAAEIVFQVSSIDSLRVAENILKSTLNDQFISRKKEYSAYLNDTSGQIISNYSTTPMGQLASITGRLNRTQPRIYNKPVGILTDAICYSACDIFTGFAEYVNITIFGFDQSTGGGGANPRSITNFMPSTKVDAYFSWKQYVSPLGQVIENRGVLTKVQVTPTLQDFTTTNFTMYKSMGEYLKKNVKQTSKI